MNGFIYIIKNTINNTINNKVYIGQTRVSVEQVINRAMKKYGVDKFYIETLEKCTI